jgi:hypothetical protein
MSDDFIEDAAPEPGVPYAGNDEFVEHEEPADGVSHLEMSQYYGAEVWRFYAFDAVRALGAKGLDRLSRAPRAADTGGPEEFFEEEAPTDGMPSSVVLYDLPPLLIDDDEIKEINEINDISEIDW